MINEFFQLGQEHIGFIIGN